MDDLIKRAEDWLQDRGGYDGYSEQEIAEIITALLARVLELSIIRTENGVVNAHLVLTYKQRAEVAESMVRELEEQLKAQQSCAGDWRKQAEKAQADYKRIEADLKEAREEIRHYEEQGLWIPEKEKKLSRYKEGVEVEAFVWDITMDADCCTGFGVTIHKTIVPFTGGQRVRVLVMKEDV